MLTVEVAAIGNGVVVLAEGGGKKVGGCRRGG